MLAKVVATTTISLILGLSTAPTAAIPPPAVLDGPGPSDSPGPEFPMKQDKGCLAVGLLPDSDVTRLPPTDTTLDLAAARALSRGEGVTVAILDTGVSPHARLPNLTGGGDFVLAEGDGLFDCDAHGTLIAGIIGAATNPGDSFQGVAPEARMVSIRVRSGAFSAEKPTSYDPADRAALEIRTLARAITRAANQGASVIVLPRPTCVAAALDVDQSMLSMAVGYATIDRGALIVAGAGSTNGGECKQNPAANPARPNDPRNWRDVETISTPSWFAPTVLTVGATTTAGAPVPDSLAGPWVSVAAPGVGIESLGPGGGGLINGAGAPDKLSAVGGASYAAAYVAGVTALLRSRYPNESPAQIASRLRETAHAPARGVDNTVGAGVIDPLAALSSRTPPAEPATLFRPAPLPMPTTQVPADRRPQQIAALILCVALLIATASSVTAALLQSRRR